MIELTFPIKALNDCSYGVCRFAISIITVRNGEKNCPAKYLGGADASDQEGGAVCEGGATL